MKIIEANNVNVMQNGFTSDCNITVDDVRKAYRLIGSRHISQMGVLR